MTKAGRAIAAGRLLLAKRSPAELVQRAKQLAEKENISHDHALQLVQESEKERMRILRQAHGLS